MLCSRRQRLLVHAHCAGHRRSCSQISDCEVVCVCAGAQQRWKCAESTLAASISPIISRRYSAIGN
jgi:hypothetical protein